MNEHRKRDRWAKQRREARAIAKESDKNIELTHRRGRRLNWLSTLLGAVTTVLAAIAALTVLPEDISRWVTAGYACAATVITAVTTTFNPKQSAHRSLMECNRWTDLRVEAHRFDRWLDTLDHKPFEEVKDEVEDALGVLQQHRARI
jgi:hypothetical protein